MNKHNRSYLQMQQEEATLASGRYNTDYALGMEKPSAASTLLGAYRKALASSGAPVFDRPVAEASGVSQNS